MMTVDDREGIAILKVGVDKEPFIIEKLEEHLNMNPVFVTDEYVIIDNRWEFRIAKIPENYEQPKLVKIFEPIKEYIDLNFKINIDKDFIFWKVLTHRKSEPGEDKVRSIGGIEVVYEGGTYEIQTGSNICWARLSEIFPEHELVGAMGE